MIIISQGSERSSLCVSSSTPIERAVSITYNPKPFSPLFPTDVSAGSIVVNLLQLNELMDERMNEFHDRCAPSLLKTHLL